jgi:hypothetical protein
MLKLAFKIAVIAGILYFGAQAAFDYALEKSIGAKVRIGGLKLNLQRAEVLLTRVRISNLKNFREPYLAVIPEIFIQIEPAAFLKGRKHIKDLRIYIQEITVERNGANEINLNELRKNLERIQAEDTAGEKGTLHAAEPYDSYRANRELIIDRAEFSAGKLLYVDSSRTPVFRREYNLNIRNEVMLNITDPASVTEQILDIILRNAGTILMSNNLSDLAADIGAHSGEIFESAKKTLSGLFDR